MKPVESALTVCVVGLACFIGGQALGMHRASEAAAGSFDAGSGLRTPEAVRRVQRTPTSPGASPVSGESFGTAAPEMLISEDLSSGSTAMPLRDIRRRLEDGANGTFMNDLLLARDSALVRWPDRTTRPLRVWIHEDYALPGWNPDFATAVRDAFDTWTQVGIPVRFTFIVDSASADVLVDFTEQFASGISGKTVWSRDTNWWLVSSNIQLALAHPIGGFVSPPQMRAIALHEVGHLLGLDHATATEHIMSARIRVRDLTDADRATARLLYSVPAGSLR
ncbi:MAG: matrixin family metalloprotease [Gemmatimonadaceae bacterium]|nr:matrixin family metalloprotease [Gemmatimonadaceae bacterium]